MSVIYINSYQFGVAYDPDAAAYIAAVEGPSGDNQSLEEPVKNAINAFVVGCKADGIWNAIKASCILAGARTLSGALVPLVGTAPTNNNFVSGDYNRKTGLVGDGSTKYLDSNRNNNADPQNNRHFSVWQSTDSTAAGGLLGSNGIGTGDSHLYAGFGQYFTRNSSSVASSQSLSASSRPTFYGTSRTSSSGFVVRHGGVDYLASISSQTPANRNMLAFSTQGYTDARLAFYSIGESLDLALLDARVTTLINAFGAAIP